MGSAWRTRTSMAASTTNLRRTTLSISSNAKEELHRSLHENRKTPQALPYRARETLQPQRSRPRRHARVGVGTEAAGEGVAGRWRPGIEPFAGHSRGAGLLGPASDSSGHGCRRKGRNDQARHVGRESAGSGCVVVQGAVGGRIEPRLPLANDEVPAEERPDRHFQPFLLRGGAGGSHPPRDSRKRKAAEAAGRETHLAAAL